MKSLDKELRKEIEPQMTQIITDFSIVSIVNKRR